MAYVILKGGQPKVHDTWAECLEQMNGYWETNYIVFMIKQNSVYA